MPIFLRVLLVVAILNPSSAQSAPCPLEDQPTLQVTLICPQNTINYGQRIRMSVRLSNRGRGSLVVARPVSNCESGTRPIAYRWSVVKDGKPLSTIPRKTIQPLPSIDVEDFLILPSGRSADVTPLAIDELFSIHENGRYDVQLTYCFDRQLLKKTGQDSISERAFGIIARIPTTECKSLPVSIKYFIPPPLRDVHSKVVRLTSELERIDSDLQTMSNDAFQLSINRSDPKQRKELKLKLDSLEAHRVEVAEELASSERKRESIRLQLTKNPDRDSP